jgi:hypothetical protein
VWLLAATTLCVETVLFPLYVVVAIGASLGWCHSRCGAPPPPLSATLRGGSGGSCSGARRGQRQVSDARFHAR